MGKTITINNYDFNFEERGRGEKILLIHGSASDRRTWRKQIEAFGNDYHVIAYSRRYHWPNKKIHEGDDYSMTQHVEDLKEIIKYFGGEPVNLIGHSYGALMGIELACNHPELIRKLVLAEPPAIRLFVSNVPTPTELLKLMFKRPKTAMSIIKLGVTGLGPATKVARTGDMKKAIQLFGKAALGKDAFNNMSDERRKQVFENLTATEFTGSGFLPLDSKAINAIQIPILLLTGEFSPKVFSNLADRLEELLPNVQRSEIAKSSHIMHEDNYENYNSKTMTFFKKNER
jgi:pimeloyl-ACP methyl ester carboxylesterase